MECSRICVVNWMSDCVDDERELFNYIYQNVLRYTGWRFKNYTEKNGRVSNRTNVDDCVVLANAGIS